MVFSVFQIRFSIIFFLQKLHMLCLYPSIGWGVVDCIGVAQDRDE
jgi:hypothetical protein